MSKRKRAARELAEVPAERHGFDSSGMLGHATGDYAVNVSEQVALAVDTVFACVRIIADLVADADVGEYRGTERLADSRLTRRPMASVTRRTWLWQVAASMALYNGVYLRRDLAGTDAEGVPLSLIPVAPPRVGWLTASRPTIDGVEVELDAIRWLPRMTFPTLSRDAAWPVKLARATIAAAWSADSYRSDFWEHGGAPTTLIKTAAALTDTRAEEIADRWVERRVESPGKPAVLSNGADAELFGADVAAEGASSAIERVGTSVARYFGVPAWLANVPTAAGSMTYNNAAAAGLDLVRYTLRPGYAGPIGDALSDELPGDYLAGRRVVLGLEHLTHGTMLERFQAYAIATAGRPFMRPGEVRVDLHLPSDPTLDLDPNGAPAPELERIAP